MRALNFLLLLGVILLISLFSCSHCDDEDNNSAQHENQNIIVDTLKLEPQYHEKSYTNSRLQ